MTKGLSTTAIFGDFGGYFLGSVTDKTINYYMAICYPLSAWNSLQNGWLWVPIGYISCQNAFTNCRTVARLPR